MLFVLRANHRCGQGQRRKRRVIGSGRTAGRFVRGFAHPFTLKPLHVFPLNHLDAFLFGGSAFVDFAQAFLPRAINQLAKAHLLGL